MRKRNKKKRKQRQVAIILGSILIAVSIVLCIKFIPKHEEQKLQITIPNENQNGTSNNTESNNENEVENNKDQSDDKDKVEENKLDNSGYLSFEEDPNADDAAMVAENTKGLLNGTKHYPVRTDGKKVVYLTFDDGPSTTNTPQVLDILDKYNVKATFFVLGKMLEAGNGEKDVLKDIAENGHAIANHTYGHDYAYLYPNGTMNVDNIVSDVEKNNDIMKEILGDDFSTRVIRFPGGYWSWEGRTPMRDKMIETGYCNIDWNALNEDAQGAAKTAEELVQKTKENIERLGPDADSVVLLMHDTYGKEETVKALPQIIEYLQDKGFEFRTIK